MTDGGVAQSDREARLIDGHAEEAQIKEGPEIAPSKTGAGRSRGLNKHWQAPEDSVDRHHDRSRENDAERCHGERGQVPKTNFRGDEVNRPNHDDDTDRDGHDTASGRGPAGGLYPHGSGQTFHSNGEFFDALAPRLVANARSCRHANRTLRRNNRFRLDDIFLPIPFPRLYVAEQPKIGKRRESNVVGPADAGLQHSPTPDWDAVLLADIVDAAGNPRPPPPPPADVDHLSFASPTV